MSIQNIIPEILNNDFAATAGIFLCHTGVCNYYNKFPILPAHTIHAP